MEIFSKEKKELRLDLEEFNLDLLRARVATFYSWRVSLGRSILKCFNTRRSTGLLNQGITGSYRVIETLVFSILWRWFEEEEIEFYVLRMALGIGFRVREKLVS